MKHMERTAAINELIIAAMMAKNSELFVRRLSLLNLDVDALVNGVPVAVAIKDVEALKADLQDRDYCRNEENFRILNEEISTSFTPSCDGNHCVEVNYIRHYTNKDGVLKREHNSRSYDFTCPSYEGFFQVEYV